MTRNSVFCIASSRSQTDQMVQRLKAAAFSIHDISVLFAAGPMIAALGDMAVGLLNQGVPWTEAKLYVDRVKEGNILVSVQTGSDVEMMQAKEVFTKAGGTNLCTTGEPTKRSRPPAVPHLVQSSEARLSIA